tara:strand:- start:1791 stop:2168 length:378 start_codon:yes stop_codon:yes gene_type:complete
MSSYVCLFRNGSLYFIGTATNLERKNQSMKPGILLASLSSQNSDKVCREIHQRYEQNRLPLTDYFRLSDNQVSEVQDQLQEFGGKQYFQTIFTGYKLFITFVFFWLFLTFLIVQFGIDPIIRRFS